MSCKEHGEKLQLFCEDEGQLICWLCDRGAQHKGHATALVEEACQGYKVSGGPQGFGEYLASYCPLRPEIIWPETQDQDLEILYPVIHLKSRMMGPY